MERRDEMGIVINPLIFLRGDGADAFCAPHIWCFTGGSSRWRIMGIQLMLACVRPASPNADPRLCSNVGAHAVSRILQHDFQTFIVLRAATACGSDLLMWPDVRYGRIHRSTTRSTCIQSVRCARTGLGLLVLNYATYCTVILCRFCCRSFSALMNSGQRVNLRHTPIARRPILSGCDQPMISVPVMNEVRSPRKTTLFITC